MTMTLQLPLETGSSRSRNTGESSFIAFASVLQNSRHSDTPSRLDPTQGTAFQFAQACTKRAEETRTALSSGASASARQRALLHGMEPQDDEDWDMEGDALAWEMEARSWLLIGMLSAERHHLRQQAATAASIDLAEEDASENPYEPPLSRAQAYIASPKYKLSELNVIRDWLQTHVLPVKHPIEARRGYWTFTKNKVRNAKRVGTANRAGASGVSLDPDFVHRNSGSGTSSTQQLEMEDSSYEKASWRFLFECARNGRLDLCFEMCKEMNQSWKAASLRGGLLYGNPLLALDEEDDTQEGASSAAVGNRKRALWKAVCRKLASEHTADSYECALYGSLGGELAPVLQVSHSWEEHLWAFINASFEAKLDQLLDSGGSDGKNWWCGKQDEAGETGSQAEDGKLRGLASLTLKDIFERLEQTNTDNIHLQANEPFRTFQRYMMLNETDSLLILVEEKLRIARSTMSRGQYAQFVRFFSHYILFKRLVDDSEQNSGKEMTAAQLAANAILRAYVELLEEAGQDDELVALYASSLDTQNAIDSYAQYLRSLDFNLDIKTRRQALLRAQEHDLDLPLVARRTVALIFDQTFPMIESSLEIMAVSSLTGDVDDVEHRLIKALDWLSFDAATYADYITEGNALMRLFLSTGRLHAARRLLSSFAPEIVAAAARELPLPDEQATEHMHWHSFFDAISAHHQYMSVWLDRRDEISATRTEKAKWEAAVRQSCQRAYDAALQILERDWLKFDLLPGGQDDGEATEQRLEELSRIRKIYVPDLLFRLHNMFYDTRGVVPQHLAQAMQLSNLVADERHKLYLEFIWPTANRLKIYLQMVRDAALALLEDGRDGKEADGMEGGRETADPFAQAALL